MKMKITAAALAGVAAAALAGAAQAQSADWTGFYVGGYVGYGAADSDPTERFEFDTNLDGTFSDTVNTTAGANAFSPGFCGGAATAATPGAGCRNDSDGVDAGVRAGYDRQYGAWVFGGVLELSRNEADDSVSAFSTTPAFYTFTREVDWMAAARLRAGYAAGPVLPYVTAGYATAKVQNSFTTSNTVNTFPEESDDRAGGFQFGVGAEYRVSPRVSLGVEYLRTSLDDDTYRVRAAGPAPATNPFILVNAQGTDMRRSNDTFKLDSLRLGANFRF